MEQEILFPDYNNCILNLVTSIIKYYGVESQFNSLKEVDALLQKKYKNVVLLVLDGMGNNILKQISPDGFLYKNKIKTITTVFPSTTTAAMTTYYSAKPPIETGWIGWTQYFKEFPAMIDVLPCKDTYTGKDFVCDKLNINDILGYETIYDMIEKENSNVKTYEILPYNCMHSSRKISVCINDVSGICTTIQDLCNGKNEKFILAYFDNPDSIMHKTGCNSDETKQFIEQTQNQIENLCKNLKGTDTLLIISADHGHHTLSKNYKITDLQELQECLILPPFLESRMLSFYVKSELKEEFKIRFNKLFKDKYILYTKKEFLGLNLLGYGKKHKKIDDFIGDFIAVAIADVNIKLSTYISEEKSDKKSSHSGLTKNEMEVPLIAIDLK